MKAWLHLEHLIFAEIKTQHLQKQKFRLCVSGGLDSMVLLSAFSHLLKADQLEVFHFHHGDFENQEFRNQAEAHVKATCAELKISFVTEKAIQKLMSEKEFRQARLASLARMHKEKPAVLVWGHHQGDLLETRLIRLIRGTGAPGLKSMQIWKAPHFRPLLLLTKTEIAEYALSRNVKFIDDPTNSSNRYLRNWLRNKWLPALEVKRPGSIRRLAQSLEHISEVADSQSHSEVQLGLSDKGLDRMVYLTLSESERGRCLAILLYQSGIRDFRTSQIKEIQKRLDNGQNELRLKMSGYIINVNAERIWIEV